MARQPKPWYRADRAAWFVTVAGTRHNLGPNKKKAFERFYALMREPQTAKVASQAFAAVADAFLDWVAANRAAETYGWYQYRLERFCQRYPDLIASEIKPYHVQQWVDSYADLSRTTRRNYIRTIKRCMKWATQQGYLSSDPIAAMEVPGAESREVCVTADEFDAFISFIRDDTLLELCRVAFETGARPQEILRVEARHFDEKNARWILPPSEAKGKQKPRIVYLSPYALEVTRKLVARYPEGKLFRNTRGKAWTTDAVNCGFLRTQIRMGQDRIKKDGQDLDTLVQKLMQSEGLTTAFKDLSPKLKRKFRYRVASSFAPKYSLYA
ncbi:MAG: tyrosine-type recombinase/integrase, partial [Aureliella sp.]